MSGHNDINKLIAPIRKCLQQKGSSIHMLGICGVGMAGLAFLLKKKGFRVTGCDQSPNHLAEWLRKRGISVFSGHDPAHVAGTDLLIRSGAVQNDIPELKAARKAGKKIFRRGMVLAAISSAADSVCVSGTHGKSTTTAMLVQLLQKAGLKPSFCIGGEVPALGGVAGFGTGSPIVLEADESDGTLAYYNPSIAVITNIEFDHAEYFRNMKDLKKCFAELVRRTKHKVIYCFDDREARKIIGKFQNAVSYGFSAGANLRLTKRNETSHGLICHFELDGKPLGRIRLPVPGKHNALNAAAACAVGRELGIPFADIARALSKFQPVSRRFERIVENKNLLVISDYAHHPTEIAALLSGTRALKRKRWLAVFQPHRYSRTKALGKLFPPAFAGVDELILCPVYEASEKIITGGTSYDLYEQFRLDGKIRTICARSLRQAWDYLKTRSAPGDGILIIGAGDVNKISDWARKELSGDKAATFNAQHSTLNFSAIGGSARADNIELKSRRSKLDVECWIPPPAGQVPAPRNAGFNVSKFPGNRLKSSAVRFNEPLVEKTTLRVGSAADIYIEAGNLTGLALIVAWARKNSVPVRMLGAGSNVLASDLGVRGIVLRLRGINWQNIRREKDGMIVAGAGVSLQKLVSWTAQLGLAGAEFLAGIPGTIGGALRMNAGAWGREFSDIVRWVRVMEQDGTVKIINRAQLGFSYRCCAGLKNRIVLEAALTLARGKADVIRKQISQIRERKKWIRGIRSAGSIFMNPAGDSAGRLIESTGLKGRTIGGAKISERHANIITTKKGATASDVLALIEIARYLVKMKYDVDLTNEVEFFE